MHITFLPLIVCIKEIDYKSTQQGMSTPFLNSIRKDKEEKHE